jgi:tetratricopeptide (TPR) repeat protein
LGDAGLGRDDAAAARPRSAAWAGSTASAVPAVSTAFASSSALEWRLSAQHALAQSGSGTERAFVARALDVPWFGQSSFAAPSEPDASRQNARRRRLIRADVTGADSLLAAYSAADHAYGGGHGRRALAHDLSHRIAPLLGLPARPEVRRDFLTVAAKLAYLCGFMHFDDALNARAQRYYRIGLRLADEADDRVGYATVLRGLSTQAEYLGHHALSAQLAQAAVDVGWHAAPVPVRAFLSGQLAVATASIGEHVASLGHFRRTERLLDRAISSTESVGAIHEATLEYQYATLAVYQGASTVAIDAYKRSLRARPVRERRSRALTLARTAELFLDGGHLESACEQWHRFLDDYPDLKSRRVDEALGTMRARLQPFSRNTVAAALIHRAAELRTSSGH